MTTECEGEESPRKVLPWETTVLITVVNQYDKCMAMPIRELANEADFWKCRGRLKAVNKHRRYLTNAILKKWVEFSYGRYVESAKKGHIEVPSPLEHIGYYKELQDRGLKLENYT